jgi:hypothetical protein
MTVRIYKGVGVGTFNHKTDFRKVGIEPRSPSPRRASVHDVCQHVARGTTTSPFISFSRSYGVAYNYALNYSIMEPSISSPAFVYEIAIPDGARVEIIDPVLLVASQQNGPLGSPSYHHDGEQGFLKYVLDPTERLYGAPMALRPPGMGAPAAARLEIELETISFALRDAEILVEGNIEKDWVKFRYDVKR